MKVIVTGGSGFIGTPLVEKLLREDYDVRIFDVRESDVFPGRCVLGDVREASELRNALAGTDRVFHLAAEHRDDVSPTSLYYEVNVGGTKNLVEAATENSVKTIVFTSTVALYGLNVGIPTEDSPPRPFNDYGRSKLEAERVLKDWAEGDAERCLVIVRPVVIFGEGNRGNVYNLLSQIRSGRFVMVGSGKNRKSMGYVGNIVDFLVKAPELGPGIHVYNYADKPDLSMKELVETAREGMGIRNIERLRLPYLLALMGGYGMDIAGKLSGRTFPISAVRIRKFCADTRVSAEKLEAAGFVPEYSLRDALLRTIAHELADRSQGGGAEPGEPEG